MLRFGAQIFLFSYYSSRVFFESYVRVCEGVCLCGRRRGDLEHGIDKDGKWEVSDLNEMHNLPSGLTESESVPNLKF